MYILALRSYGDYVIMLNSIKHAGIKKNITIIVSKHLQPLHESLNSQYSNNFKFIFLIYLDYSFIYRNISTVYVNGSWTYLG